MSSATMVVLASRCPLGPLHRAHLGRSGRSVVLPSCRFHPAQVPSNLPSYANQPRCKNDSLAHSESGDWLRAGSSPVGSDQKVVVIADPGICRTHPPETAVLVQAYRVQQVRWVVGGHKRFCLTRSHAARVRLRVAPGFALHKPHTSINPEFRSVDPLRTLPVYLKLT